MGIRVKVKDDMVGFYDHRRWRSGQEFEIEHEREFSPKWMERDGSIAQHNLAEDHEEPSASKPGRKPGRKPKAVMQEAESVE